MSETLFAYGSNMCSGRFREYGVIPDGKGRAALLADHRLLFNKRSTKDGSGKANVGPHLGGEVWGVLYTVSGDDLKLLDAGEIGYSRTRLPVQIDNISTEAWIYIAWSPSPDLSLRPYTWYKRFLLEGAKEHGLLAQYVSFLEQIEATQDKNEKRDREKHAIACQSEV